MKKTAKTINRIAGIIPSSVNFNGFFMGAIRSVNAGQGYCPNAFLSSSWKAMISDSVGLSPCRFSMPRRP